MRRTSCSSRDTASTVSWSCWWAPASRPATPCSPATRNGALLLGRRFARAHRARQGGRPRGPHADPLADIRNTLAIDRVMVRGLPVLRRLDSKGLVGGWRSAAISWPAPRSRRGCSDGSGRNADAPAGPAGRRPRELGELAGEALLLTLFGALWFGEPRRGRVVAACSSWSARLREWPIRSPARGRARPSAGRGRRPARVGAPLVSPTVARARVALLRRAAAPARRSWPGPRWAWPIPTTPALAARAGRRARGGDSARRQRRRRGGAHDLAGARAAGPGAIRRRPGVSRGRRLGARAAGCAGRLRRGLRQDPARAARLRALHRRVLLAGAAATERLAPITLPNGKVFRAEPAARFAISCLGAARGAPGGSAGPAGGRRATSTACASLAEGWTDWNGFFAPDVIVAGLHALALGGPAYRATVERRGRAGGGAAAARRPVGQRRPVPDHRGAAGDRPAGRQGHGRAARCRPSRSASGPTAASARLPSRSGR